MPYKPFFSFAQCFGDRVTEEDNNEADVLSTARFDETGDYLATGDKGGRVVVFQRSDSGKNRHSRKRPHSAVAPAGELLETTRDFGGAGGMGGATGRRGEPVGVKGPSGAEYSFFAEFQSHSPEFDCLKSAEIEEKINKVSAGDLILWGTFLVGGVQPCNNWHTLLAVLWRWCGIWEHLQPAIQPDFCVHGCILLHAGVVVLCLGGGSRCCHTPA